MSFFLYFLFNVHAQAKKVVMAITEPNQQEN
jgi:hypothetical protein